MKLLSIYLVCLFITVALAALDPNWRLAWSDEFDTLDTTKWNIRNRPGNYGNSELQWYHPNQTTVNSSNLVISAIKKSWGGESYLSGWIDSMDKAYFTYARYEVRAKMTVGKGMWPAIWLLSQTGCWALGAEVDLAEFRGSYPTRIGTYYHYATQCCAIYGSCISSKGSEHTTAYDLTADYHVYAVEWSPTTTTWYLDGVKIDSYTASTLVTTEDPSPKYWIINSAVGGGYPGNPDSTNKWPSNLYIDYVRVYEYRTTCSGVTCSGHGCCNANTMRCVCNSGWAGLNCEANVGSYTNNFDMLTNMDNIPNGWGNPQTLYLQTSSVITNGALKMTLSNAGCPASCGNLPYSSGAWESIPRYPYGTFAYQARGPKTSGTGFSLGAAGESAALEQFAWVLTGTSRTTAALWTWTNNWAYQHATVNLGFDHSSTYHTYTVSWTSNLMIWYVDGKQVFNHTDVIPNAPRLGPGAYYSAESDWYGGAVAYSSPASVYITQFAWNIIPTFTATC